MMRFLAALAVTTAVLASLPVPLVAQGTVRTVPAPQQPADLRFAEPVEAEALRERLKEVLQRYPRSVGRVLRLDPTLFNDATYMASYPDIAQFVARYPQVARNPDYYLAEYSTSYESNTPRDPRERSIDLMEGLFTGAAALAVFVVITWMLVWIVRNIVDHRRWLRVSKIQTEVHSKLLDRFSSNEELLAYMKTPAGSRFLESAPIALDAAPTRAVSAPLNRILWSVQTGVVVLLAGASLFVARNYTAYEEVRSMLSMMGIVVAFVGIGFILSAVASYVLSKRLGLLDGTGHQPSTSVPSTRIDSAGA